MRPCVLPWVLCIALALAAPARSDDAPAGVAAGAPADECLVALTAIRELRSKGEFEKVVGEVAVLVARLPADTRAHVAYQNLQRDLGRDAAVEAEYRARAKAEGATADDLFLHARLLRGTRAVQQYRAALKLDAGHFASLVGLGIELTAVRDFRGAEQSLESARTLRPSSGAPWNALGRLAEARGDRPAAETAYRRAIELDGKLIVARVNLGVLLSSARRTADAVSVLTDAAAADPMDPAPLVALGLAHLQADRPEEAVAAFERALGVDPRSIASLNMIAAAWMNLGKLDLAEKAVERSVAANPRSVPTWVQMAHLRLAQGRFDDVHAAAARALAIDPSAAAPHQVAGLAFERQGELKKAEGELRKAVRAEDDSAVLHRTLAQFLGRQDRWKDALKEFQIVSDLTGAAPEALYDLALAHVGVNEPRRASELLALVVASDPGHLSAWIKLGILRRDRTRDAKGALTAFREYVARGGKDARVPRWITELEAKK